MMLPDQKDRECFINLVWDTELKGGISISEYSAFLAEDAATAFVSGAYIATILVCCSAIESHLKFDGGHGYNLFELSSNFGLKMDLVNDIDRVRQFRNSWVHVRDPENDSLLQEKPDVVTKQCEEMARLAYTCLVRTLSSFQYV